MAIFNSNIIRHNKWSITKQSAMNYQKRPQFNIRAKKLIKSECRSQMKDKIWLTMQQGQIINPGSQIESITKSQDSLCKHSWELSLKSRLVRTLRVIKVTRGWKETVKTWCHKMILQTRPLNFAIRRVNHHKDQSLARCQSKANLLRDRK